MTQELDIAVAALSLLSLKGIGPQKTNKILSTISNQDIGYDGLLDIVRKNNKTVDEHEWVRAWPKSQQILEKQMEVGIRFVTPIDSNYPPLLNELNDRPPILFYKGNIAILNKPLPIAIVGSRRASNEHIDSFKRICTTYSKKSDCIVSGLAEGCDTIAHLSCLETGKPTAAILAHGLDTVFPHINNSLASKILDQNGCLISEYVLGTPPTKYNFIARDRIQAGVSIAGLLLQSTASGGSMHAIRKLYKLNRKILTIIPKINPGLSGDWGGNLIASIELSADAITLGETDGNHLSQIDKHLCKIKQENRKLEQLDLW